MILQKFIVIFCHAQIEQVWCWFANVLQSRRPINVTLCEQNVRVVTNCYASPSFAFVPIIFKF